MFSILRGKLCACAILTTIRHDLYDDYTAISPKDEYRHHHKYKVEQSQFEKENKETLVIVCSVVVTCEQGEKNNCSTSKTIHRISFHCSVGTHGKQKAKLYSLVVTNSNVSGNMLEKDSGDKGDDTKTPMGIANLSPSLFIVNEPWQISTMKNMMVLLRRLSGQ